SMTTPLESNHPLAVPPRKPNLDANLDPWPESPITWDFRNEIAKRESQRGGYGAVNPTGSSLGAWGRYQMLRDALIEAEILPPMFDPSRKRIDAAKDFLRTNFLF